jgi:hypothetical protein
MLKPCAIQGQKLAAAFCGPVLQGHGHAYRHISQHQQFECYSHVTYIFFSLHLLFIHSVGLVYIFLIFSLQTLCWQ